MWEVRSSRFPSSTLLSVVFFGLLYENQIVGKKGNA